jgi:hypothetical protein
MKLRHRQAHLRIWITLAVLLTLGLGAGLVLKQPVPFEPRSLNPGRN